MATDTTLRSRTRAHYPHITPPIATRWHDNDIYTHLNNTTYLTLFDTCVNSFLITHCSFSPTTSPQIGLVVHSHCDYFGSISFPSEVEVGLRIKKLGKSSVEYELAVFERGVEGVRCVGGFVHVFVERESRRPVKEGMERSVKVKLEELVVRQAKL